jgi:hypothetical protein
MPTAARLVEVFLYGLFMDVDVLRRQDIAPARMRPALADGFALRIRRRATLVPQAGARSYGMLTALTHEEIGRLYGAPGLEGYRAEAVMAEVIGGEAVAALCYNLVEDPEGECDLAYARQLRALLRRLGFPAEYYGSLPS